MLNRSSVSHLQPCQKNYGDHPIMELNDIGSVTHEPELPHNETPKASRCSSHTDGEIEAMSSGELYRLARVHHAQTNIEIREAMSKQHAKKSTVADDRGLDASRKKKGAFLGVFIPTCENMWGVLIFLQFHVVVGNAGVLEALLAVFISFSAAFCTTASLTAIASSGGFISEGGPYYMISRTMGPTVGATVGLMYFLGLTLLAVLEVLGALETVLMVDPEWEIDGARQVYGSVLMLALVITVHLGIHVVTKLGAFFAVIVFFTIGSYYAGITQAKEGNTYSHQGVTGLSWGTLGENMQSHYLPDVTFGRVMATFFPCFTGILSGANRADVLKDPPSDIKYGTYGAIIFSCVMYSSFMLLWGSVASYSYLRGDAEPTLRRLAWGAAHRRLGSSNAASYVVSDIAWSPFEHCAHIGIIISSLSQALQCIIVASKLLQSIAADRIIQSMRFAAPLSAHNEPTRALSITYLVGATCVLIGRLDVVAPLLSMFFLTAYANMNASCGILTCLRASSWRPQGIYHAKWRAWYQITSFIGFILCLLIMFIINVLWASIALLATIILYGFVDWQTEKVEWGSGLDGLKFHVALSSLLSLENRQAYTVNWRPQVLILYRIRLTEELKGIKRHEILTIYSQLRKGHGMCVVAAVLEGDKRDPHALHKARSEKQIILDIMREERIPGFAEVVVAPTWCEGANYIIQLTGLGGLVPNTLLMGWPHDWKKSPEKASDFVSIVQTALAGNKSILCAKDLANFPTNPCRGTMDIWWMIHDGGFMILLSWLLTQHRVWKNCHIRVFTVTENCDPEKAKRAAQVLSAILRKKRLADVDVEVIIADNEVMEPFSTDRNFFTERQKWFQDLQQLGLINEDRVKQKGILLPVEIDDLFAEVDGERLNGSHLKEPPGNGEIHVFDKRKVSCALSEVRKSILVGDSDNLQNMDSTLCSGAACYNECNHAAPLTTSASSFVPVSINGLQRKLSDDSLSGSLGWGDETGRTSRLDGIECSGSEDDFNSPASAKTGSRRRKLTSIFMDASERNAGLIPPLNRVTAADTGVPKSPSAEKLNRTNAPVELALARDFNPPSCSPECFDNTHEQALYESFRTLNGIIMSRSKRAELVVVNLPEIWSQEEAEAKKYMICCDILTEGLDRVLLIHSSGHEVFDI